METFTLASSDEVRSLVARAHDTDEPIVVFDGADECLIAMRPAVFERILFDSRVLNGEGGSLLHV